MQKHFQCANKKTNLRSRMLSQMNWTLESRLHKHIPKLHARPSLRRLSLHKDQTYLTIVSD